MVWLEHGQPILFAKGTKGLKLDPGHLRLEIAEVTDGDWKAAGVLVHDETNRALAQLLIDMPAEDFPIALGIIYCDPMPSFDSAVAAQDQKAAAGKKGNLQALLSSGETWSIGPDTPAATGA